MIDLDIDKWRKVEAEANPSGLKMHQLMQEIQNTSHLTNVVTHVHFSVGYEFHTMSVPIHPYFGATDHSLRGLSKGLIPDTSTYLFSSWHEYSEGKHTNGGVYPQGVQIEEEKEQKLVVDVEEITLANWMADLSEKPSQVHLIISTEHIVDFVIRFKSPKTLDNIILDLIKRRSEVWG